MKSPKVLVLGGISESVDLTAGLLKKGFQVLVSRATNVYQNEKSLPGVIFRHGSLSRVDLENLALRENISAIIDCTHPFATQISWNAHQTAVNLSLPFLVYDRPGHDPDAPGIHRARDHQHGADLTLSREEVIFLSIGSNNIGIYADKAGKMRTRLAARVLPGKVFKKKCLDAGLKEERIIQARGPFSVHENIGHFQGVDAGCLVTKDSGEAGGVPAKLEAARILGISVVMINRPPRPGRLKFDRIDELIRAVEQSLRGP